MRLRRRSEYVSHCGLAGMEPSSRSSRRADLSPRAPRCRTLAGPLRTGPPTSRARPASGPGRPTGPGRPPAARPPPSAPPAQALLYIEFLLDEGQEILAEYGRTPAVPTVEGGLPEGVPVLWVDLDQMLDEREKWEGLYAEVLQASDSEVLEG